MSALLLAAVACVPRVELAAPPALEAPVQAALEARQVATGAAPPGCPVARLELHQGGEGIEARFAGPDGQREARTVRDPAVLAALVEGWLRPDLAAPLLELPPPPSPAPDRAPAAPTGWSVAAAAELGRSGAGDVQSGAVARLGLEGGLLHPEVAVRLAFAEREERPAATAASLWLADLLLGVRLPVRWGAVSVAPGLAAGLGLDGAARAACTSCALQVDDDARRLEATARLEASVLVGATLGRALALEAGGSWGLSPFADAAARAPSWAGQAPGERFALPGAARSHLRAGLGLRWRVP